ncbi:MAG: cupin domain-containing protein [Roseburia sp.]|nr:cupin domain-containing protein [Roseburia sp.]
MAIIIRKEERDFQPNPNKIDGFRLFTDMSREQKGIRPQYLNFDLRKLNPWQYNAPYHFHRYAEEMFLILSGTATLRTHTGLEVVNEGDILFFEAGESGAHQLYNHSDAPCTYLDMRSYIGHDVCEYPDSDKIILVPNGETFRRSEQHPYFNGETEVDKVWEQLRRECGE